MSDESGATGDLANQEVNRRTFQEAVTLQFIAEAWEIQVTDQVEDARFIEADDILDTIDRYLASQFESPTFEWICADILAYAEIRTFGEETKQNAPGIGGSYYSSAGNLHRMRLNSQKEELGWAAAKLAFWVGIPIVIGARYWYLGRFEKATLVAISWVILVAVWVVLRGLTGSRRPPMQLAPEVKHNVELRRKMGAAYRQITSDNSPSIVLKNLQGASAEGAVCPAVYRHCWKRHVRETLFAGAISPGEMGIR
jgi:hypothetical protein